MFAFKVSWLLNCDHTNRITVSLYTKLSLTVTKQSKVPHTRALKPVASVSWLTLTGVVALRVDTRGVGVASVRASGTLVDICNRRAAVETR